MWHENLDLHYSSLLNGDNWIQIDILLYGIFNIRAREALTGEAPLVGHHLASERSPV